MSIDNFTGADEFDVDSFLDGNARSAFKKKDGVPHELTGTITMIKPAAPVKDYDTGEIKCYPGTTDVIKQLPVVVSTAERDPEIIGDNGDRTIYFDGDLLKALRTAVKLSGAKLRVGGTLWVKKTQGPSPKTGNTKNFWEVTYAPAAGGTADVDALLETPPAPTGLTVPTIPQPTQAASIAAKLAAAQATPPSAATVADLAARFGIDEKAAHAIKNMSKEQAGAVGLADQWNELQTAS